MAEYIEREALIAHIKDLPTWWADAGGVYGRSMKYPEGMFDCEDVISSVENAPTADVAPVVRGRWIPNTEAFTPANRCSACGYNDPEIAICRGTYQFVRQESRNYCPNCGAKMDGKEGDA